MDPLALPETVHVSVLCVTPPIVRVQKLLPPTVRVEGVQVATGARAVTTTDAVPLFVGSAWEVAVITPVPAADGVNNPPEVIVPSVVVQVTF
jgi:hypothetical protein